MGAEPGQVNDPSEHWAGNYFNYFTEIEEHFQQTRGTSLFLLSPLDWALIAAWKEAGVPLEAVLRGIDAAFEKWRARKSKVRMVNSLAYCAQEVLAQAQMISRTAQSPPQTRAKLFGIEELRQYLTANAESLRRHGQLQMVEIVASLERLASGMEQYQNDLELLEQHLTALEDKMIAILQSRQTEDQLVEARRELERQLRPYRGKMTAEQLTMLEKQYLERRLLEAANLPRLSLFYMR